MEIDEPKVLVQNKDFLWEKVQESGCLYLITPLYPYCSYENEVELTEVARTTPRQAY